MMKLITGPRYKSIICHQISRLVFTSFSNFFEDELPMLQAVLLRLILIFILLLRD